MLYLHTLIVSYLGSIGMSFLIKVVLVCCNFKLNYRGLNLFGLCYMYIGGINKLTVYNLLYIGDILYSMLFLCHRNKTVIRTGKYSDTCSMLHGI